MSDGRNPPHDLTELRRGTIAMAVMLYLRNEDHGYGLRRAFLRVGLPVKEGTLYPLLRRLEGQGLLKGRWDSCGERQRKYYSLTEAGHEILLNWCRQWMHLIEVVETLDSTSSEDGDRMILKYGVAR